MAGHNELGRKGEEAAVAYLINNGYEILHKNYTFQKAEIDILAKINSTLAVIEVKTRSSIKYGLPQEFVSSKKIQLLVKAVNAYIVQYDIDLNVRFDIIAIQKNGESFVIEHLTEAFYHF